MHKKTAIRKYIESYLKSKGFNVQAGRIDTNIDIAYPILAVRGRKESIDYTTTTTIRNLKLEIVVMCKYNATEDIDFDEVIENEMLKVEKAMSLFLTVLDDDSTGRYLIDNIYLTDTETATNNDSENDFGYAIMNYSVIYAYQNPIEPIPLEIFEGGNINLKGVING